MQYTCLPNEQGGIVDDLLVDLHADHLIPESCTQCFEGGHAIQFVDWVLARDPALRIAVNDELASLERLLEVSTEVIKPGGRLVVMSYHSLEDRLVKNWMRAGDLEGKEEKDLFGNSLRPFKPTQSKAVQPSEREQLENPRARSARLRTAVRQ